MIPFALGQIGLGLTAVFGISIAHITNQFRVRPPWYVTVLIWLVSVMAVFALSDPLVFPRIDYLPLVAYLFRFVVGLFALAFFVRLRFSRGRPLPKTVVSRLNHLITYGCAAIVVIVLGYWQYGDRLDSNHKFSSLQREVRTNQRMMVRDTQQTANLQRTIDRQNLQMVAYQAQIKNLNDQLAGSNVQLRQLTNVVATLSRYIKLIGRQQSTLHQDIGDIKSAQGPQKLPPPAPKVWALPPDRVQPFGPKRKP
ncbi:DUF3450 domain-containing protein [Spirosoma sp. KCTC 42546]|uniref:DUF3450 domain-containing protein n=1 Tax=Spirosoma sp. KCTC 42546 TaxID=2520506 RepID=UPI0011570F8B|nr:DUF3450 domain-containing protein [Spirosoma sp. KCTC 42546]QDK80843.1 DUF3450 domain-containing protein [Spirosoma sp. KCTC 42546]